MLDCELVLRFFALREKSNIRGSVRSMLDRYMEGKVDVTKSELTELRDIFLSRLKLAHDLFGDRVFRYKHRESGEYRLSQTLYDGIMVALDKLWGKRTRLLSQKERIVQDVEKLLADASAFEVIVGRANTAEAIRQRLDMLSKVIRG